MLFVPRAGRAVHQLFGNLNGHMPINDLNRPPFALRAEQKTPALSACCAKPQGEFCAVEHFSAETPKMIVPASPIRRFAPHGADVGIIASQQWLSSV
jgi:hypothetical protein